MPIPKTIHFIWAGGSKLLPEDRAASIKEWAKKNPGFEVNLWIDKKTTSPELLEEYNNAVYAFNNDPKIILKDITEEGVVDEYSRYHIDKLIPNYGASSDLLRYAILKKFGGIYLDGDVVVDDNSKPLNYKGLFDSDKSEILKINQFTQNSACIGNDGIICTPNHPFIAELYETAKKNHRTVTSEVYTNHKIYDFDSSLSIKEQHYNLKQKTSIRNNWTIGCTGPRAVRQVCQTRGMLSEGANIKNACLTSDPEFALDTNCFKPAESNDGNWIMPRVTQQASIEEAIETVIKEIHFEARNMGILALDYHISAIMQSRLMGKATLSEQDVVANKLISALNTNPPDYSKVTQIQLLSKYAVVREHYKTNIPGIVDNLSVSQNEPYSLAKSRAMQALSELPYDDLKTPKIDYANHVYQMVRATMQANSEKISLEHISKLIFANIMLATYYESLSEPLTKNIKEAINDTLPIAISNHLKNNGNIDNAIEELSRVMLSYSEHDLRNEFDAIQEHIMHASKNTNDKNVLSVMTALQERVEDLKNHALAHILILQLLWASSKPIPGLDELSKEQNTIKIDEVIKKLKELLKPYYTEHSQTLFPPTVDKFAQLVQIINRSNSWNEISVKFDDFLKQKTSTPPQPPATTSPLKH